MGRSTASQVDFSHVLSTKLPLFIAVVIALAALLLVAVFRSLGIPVQAAVMNLLSIAASLGGRDRARVAEQPVRHPGRPD